MSIAIIRSKITTVLNEWASGLDTPISIAREGQPFPKPDDLATFLQLLIIPADTIVASLDGTSKRYLGEVRINIWFKDGEGMGEGEELAEAISDLFPVVPKSHLPVSVETVPSIKPSILDDSGYRILPVCFSYRAEF